MPVTDFDFLPGRWHVANRKLANMLDPACTEWTEFEASSEAWKILDGLGNVDRLTVVDDDYRGFTLRLYDPAADLWRIWWASTGRPGRLDPPVEGRFVDGVGRFACDDVLDGVPIGVRFEWSDVAGPAPRWEQGFSFDGGATWTLNWTMAFTRAG